MKKEQKYYQIYHIHLLNGEVVEASEAYDLPAEKVWSESLKKRTITKSLKSEILFLGLPIFPNAVFFFYRREMSGRDGAANKVTGLCKCKIFCSY